MSVLEPIRDQAINPGFRSELPLGSSAKRNEVNLDSNNRGTPSTAPDIAQANSESSVRNAGALVGSERNVDYVTALRSAVGLIQHELVEVEHVLTDQLLLDSTTQGTATIQLMLDYVKELGGKRLRPSLTLLAAKACGGVTEETIRLAAAIELVHTATLVHDDIIDQADERRHRPTAHKLWGAHQSVLIGDWLFTHAYELANMGQSTLPGRLIARAAKRVCEGEILQGQSVGRVDLEEEEYFSILDAKTGALCEISCRLGAWSAGADEATVEAFAGFGSKLGIAFQIYDDWLDIWGDPKSAGKTLGTDLLALKPTLPTIFALTTRDNALPSLASEISHTTENTINSCFTTTNARDFKSRWLDGSLESQAELRDELDKIGASSYTRNRANEIGAEAIELLTNVGKSKALQACYIDALAHLAYCATHRHA